jgi:hypothetical protein
VPIGFCQAQRDLNRRAGIIEVFTEALDQIGRWR